MRKYQIFLAAAMLSMGLAACGNKPEETKTVEQTQETSAVQETEVTESSEKTLETTGEEDVLTDNTDDKALIRSTIYAIQNEVATGLTMNTLPFFCEYPINVGPDGGKTVESEEELETMDVDAVLTPELRKAVEECDVESLDLTGDTIILGNPEKPNVVLKVEDGGEVYITEFNY